MSNLKGLYIATRPAEYYRPYPFKPRLHVLEIALPSRGKIARVACLALAMQHLKSCRNIANS